MDYKVAAILILQFVCSSVLSHKCDCTHPQDDTPFWYSPCFQGTLTEVVNVVSQDATVSDWVIWEKNVKKGLGKIRNIVKQARTFFKGGKVKELYPDVSEFSLSFRTIVQM